MIQLEEIHIEEFRGIRKLTLELNRKSFAIQGPNGSGKSGVVDAIEFGLTGDVTRLTGRGTQGLTVKKHGPHVDVRDTPASAFVRLKVFLPKLNTTATLTRTVKDAKKPLIEHTGKKCADKDVIEAIEEVALHPEIALSRRQIIKFILTEATNRSKDVQTLLRLDGIEKTRAILKKAENTSSSTRKTKKGASQTAAETLCRHIEAPKLSPEAILKSANKYRETLGLPTLTELTATTSIKHGLGKQSTDKDAVSKPTATADLETARKVINGNETESEIDLINQQLAILDDDPELHTAIRRQQLVELGLAVLDADECPLCDQEWDLEKLRAHLLAKLEASKQAVKVATTIRNAGRTISTAIQSHAATLRTVKVTAERLKQEQIASDLSEWAGALDELTDHLKTVDGIAAAREKLTTWNKPIPAVAASLAALDKAVAKLPDDNKASDRDFLVVADERLEAWRSRKREERDAAEAANLAKAAYDSFCSATESVLESLYSDVEQSFTASYRAINGDDEGEFTAKLTPAEGKLELDVDFHKRGLFHPGAYHSEGHQDGMGLCLYLALMKQLFGDEFRLVILDDVVMSVDCQHRKELCRVLKEGFPDTQFVITTHEKAWFHQMRSAKLINRKSGLTFRGWSVDTGPLVNEATDVWEDIDAALKVDDVPAAAARLRRYLEFIAGDLAEAFRASVPFRCDADHDLGDVLPHVIHRFKTLLARASTTAQAWKDDDTTEKLKELKTRLGESSAEKDIEQWAVNSAVHYNAWADFVKQDFQSVVAAFRKLLDCFCCPNCGSWLYATPRKGTPEAIRCDCNKTNFNLKEP